MKQKKEDSGAEKEGQFFWGGKYIPLSVLTYWSIMSLTSNLLASKFKIILSYFNIWSSHLMQLLELLQLPLVLQDQTVPSGPPSSQVLLSSHVSHRSVQNLPPPPLHPCTGEHGSLRPMLGSCLYFSLNHSFFAHLGFRCRTFCTDSAHKCR